MRAAKNFQLQVVLPHSPQHLSDALAVDSPAGQVSKVDQVGKSFQQDLKCTDSQLWGFINVEAFQTAGVVHPGYGDAEICVCQVWTAVGVEMLQVWTAGQDH